MDIWHFKSLICFSFPFIFVSPYLYLCIYAEFKPADIRHISACLLSPDSCLLFASLLDSALQYIEYIHICQMSTVQNIGASAQSQTHFIMSSWTDKLSNLVHNVWTNFMILYLCNSLASIVRTREASIRYGKEIGTLWSMSSHVIRSEAPHVYSSSAPPSVRARQWSQWPGPARGWSGGRVWPRGGLSLVTTARCWPLIGRCRPGEPAQPAADSGTGSSRIFVFGNIFRHRLQTFSLSGADRGSFSLMSSPQMMAVRELKRFLLQNI